MASKWLTPLTSYQEVWAQALLLHCFCRQGTAVGNLQWTIVASHPGVNKLTPGW